MLKIIGCILILGASTFGGFVYSEIFKYRVQELKEIERGIYQLQNEIIYTYTPIPEALKKVSIKGTKPIAEIFNNISLELLSNKYDSVYDAFFYVFKSSRDNLHLKSGDINEVLDLSKSLGESDVNGQVTMFSLTIENIKKRIESAENIMKNSVKMYRYLGFSVGAMLVIMLY